MLILALVVEKFCVQDFLSMVFAGSNTKKWNQTENPKSVLKQNSSIKFQRRLVGLGRGGDGSFGIRKFEEQCENYGILYTHPFLQLKSFGPFLKYFGEDKAVAYIASWQFRSTTHIWGITG